MARAWTKQGIGHGDVIAVLCRDHRGLITVLAAAGKVGAQLLLMNTGFAKPQLAEVARREHVTVLVYDEEFTELLGGIDPGVRTIRRLRKRQHGDNVDGSLEGLIRSTSAAPVPAPAKPGGMTLLTSGTTGTPKGAPRTKTSPLFSAQLLDRVPRRRHETCLMAAPIFHGTGLGQAVLSLALGNRLVLRRRFDPEETLRAIAAHRCDVLVVVPTMLQRILALPKEVRDRYDTSSLRIIFASGSAMPPDLVNRALDAVRTGAVQPLRFDRARGDDRREARRPDPRSADGRKAAGGLHRQAVRRRRQADHRTATSSAESSPAAV